MWSRGVGGCRAASLPGGASNATWHSLPRTPASLNMRMALTNDIGVRQRPWRTPARAHLRRVDAGHCEAPGQVGQALRGEAQQQTARQLSKRLHHLRSRTAALGLGQGEPAGWFLCFFIWCNANECCQSCLLWLPVPRPLARPSPGLLAMSTGSRCAADGHFHMPALPLHPIPPRTLRCVGESKRFAAAKANTRTLTVCGTKALPPAWLLPCPGSPPPARLRTPLTARSNAAPRLWASLLAPPLLLLLPRPAPESLLLAMPPLLLLLPLLLPASESIPPAPPSRPSMHSTACARPSYSCGWSYLRVLKDQAKEATACSSGRHMRIGTGTRRQRSRWLYLRVLYDQARDAAACSRGGHTHAQAPARSISTAAGAPSTACDCDRGRSQAARRGGRMHAHAHPCCARSHLRVQLLLAPKLNGP